MKTILLPAVAHVGAMNPEKKNYDSQEGSGLSVSIHPMAWGHIWKIGSKGFVLHRDGTDARFLDARKLADSERAEILGWAKESGYLVEGEAWKLTYFDTEIEQRWAEMFDTKEQAVAFTEKPFCKRARITGPFPEIRSTPRLIEEAHQKPDKKCFNDGAFDLALTLYAEDLDVDGVWWRDRLDAYALSAPRGVILNSRLDEFDAIPFDFRSDDLHAKLDLDVVMGLKISALRT